MKNMIHRPEKKLIHNQGEHAHQWLLKAIEKIFKIC